MRVFTIEQLGAAANDLGGHVRFRQELPEQQPVLAGWQEVQPLGCGLVLYLSQSRDLVDADSQNLLPAGITAAFLLQGKADVSLARDRVRFDAGQVGQCAMLVNLTEADVFQRHWQSDRQETKVCLSFTPAWFEQFADEASLGGRQLQQFSRNHWQDRHWQPSLSLLQRARQLFSDTTAAAPLVRRMQRESFALELASDILLGIEAPPRPRRLAAHLEQCLARLKEWLDSGEADQLGIAQMARTLGTNPVDLQNGFRLRNGTTIAAYLRRQRLERACQGLQQGLSVDQAASLAGYEHASSFSAAFKRQYGVAPSQVGISMAARP